jgi:hypothetical protein
MNLNQKGMSGTMSGDGLNYFLFGKGFWFLYKIYMNHAKEVLIFIFAIFESPKFRFFQYLKQKLT